MWADVDLVVGRFVEEDGEESLCAASILNCLGCKPDGVGVFIITTGLGGLESGVVEFAIEGCIGGGLFVGGVFEEEDDANGA